MSGFLQIGPASHHPEPRHVGGSARRGCGLNVAHYAQCTPGAKARPTEAANAGRWAEQANSRWCTGTGRVRQGECHRRRDLPFVGRWSDTTSWSAMPPPPTLPRVTAISYEAATEGDSNPPALPGVPSLYGHGFETQELFVLKRDDHVAAFATVINRGAVSFLTDLLAAAADRSTGLGQRLLKQVLPDDGRPCCTVRYGDANRARD